MKYAVHLVVMIVIGWPSLAAGYLWAAVLSNWSTGKFLYDVHEADAIKKWCKR